MQLHHWCSKAVENYGPGQLIAMAASVEEARQKILAKRHEILSAHFLHLDPKDPDDEEAIQEVFSQLEADLAVEPSLEEVVVIRGSD